MKLKSKPQLILILSIIVCEADLYTLKLYVSPWTSARAKALELKR